jgi:hypothetical protein
MPQEQLTKEQIAVALMDLLDEAGGLTEGYHVAKRRMRLLIAERFDFDKLRCTVCRLWKDKAAYSRNGARSRGLDYECKECRSRYCNIKGGRY